MSENNKVQKTFEPINFCDGVYWSPDGVKRPADGLAVRLTAFCDNSCSFCISAEDMLEKRPVNIPKMIEEVKKSGATSLQILGGEPLLFLDDCIEFASGVREQIKFMFFTTSIPYTIESQWEKFEKLMEVNDALTISIQSTDWKENNEILRAKKKFNRIETLKKIVKQYGDRVTVVLNLSKGGIDTYDKLWDSMDDLYSFGVKRVRVNELQKAPESYVSFEKISGISLKSPYAHGCKTNVKLYDSMSVLVKRSCFLVEDSLSGTEDDFLKLEEKERNPEKFAWQKSNVIYEDGSLAGYWEKSRKSVLSEEVEEGYRELQDFNKDSSSGSNKVSLGMPKIRTREELNGH